MEIWALYGIRVRLDQLWQNKIRDTSDLGDIDLHKSLFGCIGVHKISMECQVQFPTNPDQSMIFHNLYLSIKCGPFLRYIDFWSVTCRWQVDPEELTLLENGPSAPVEEGLRYRFSNRHPQTETIGLVLGYRVTQPVPLAPIGTGWKNQPVPLRLPRWRKRAASLVPVGNTNRYQRVFPVYLKFLFYFFCLFFENCSA